MAHGIRGAHRAQLRQTHAGAAFALQSLVHTANRSGDSGRGAVDGAGLADVSIFFNELDVRSRIGVPMDALALNLGSIDGRFFVPLFVLLFISLHDRVQRPVGSGDRRAAVSVKFSDRLRARVNRGERLLLARIGRDSKNGTGSTGGGGDDPHAHLDVVSLDHPVHFDLHGDSMAKTCALFIALILITVRISPDFRERWVIWNVGQGQWATYVEAASCWHFDMGGEHPPWARLEKLCRARRNFVFLSHWDWDHIGFVGQAPWHLPEICLIGEPGGPGTLRARRWIHKVDMCDDEAPFEFWNALFARNSNGWSRVAFWKGALLPGDSTKIEEKRWHFQLKGISKTRILMLGHHGSRSSTSKALLASLPNLKMAIASSRRARYGHPHAETIRRLVEARVPLLTTEDWGTIEIW